MKFSIANSEMAQYVHRVMPKHMIAPEVGSTTAGLARPLETTTDSSLEYLSDLLYAEPGMPEGCVSQLLACDKQYRGELKAILMEHREVFPMELPKRVPPNRGLRDKMEISLCQGQSPSSRRYIDSL